MIGIENIASYICENRENNAAKRFNNEPVDESFIINKVGISKIAVKKDGEKSSDLCVKALENLANKYSEFDKTKIDCICVCTQNGDYNLPHTSAIVHGKLKFEKNCAAFDISLGCSGYVYAIGIMKAYMEQNGFKKGLLFTSDPYSEIIDKNDKNTNLIFGDGASVTLLSENALFDIGKTNFYTDGSLYDTLIHKSGSPLFMDGRMIFNFALANVPETVNKTLEQENITADDIDLFIFHQASKYIIDNIARRMKLDKSKAPFNISDYGNTVSSSIPVILEQYLHKNNNILLCGFGVGLSIASTIIHRRKQ